LHRVKNDSIKALCETSANTDGSLNPGSNLHRYSKRFNIKTNYEQGRQAPRRTLKFYGIHRARNRKNIHRISGQ
jgi:hypothetical protein